MFEKLTAHVDEHGNPRLRDFFHAGYDIRIRSRSGQHESVWDGSSTKDNPIPRDFRWIQIHQVGTLGIHVDQWIIPWCHDEIDHVDGHDNNSHDADAIQAIDLKIKSAWNNISTSGKGRHLRYVFDQPIPIPDDLTLTEARTFYNAIRKATRNVISRMDGFDYASVIDPKANSVLWMTKEVANV